jgi:spore germination cell wall hydrolase CwlJ-like protein
VPDKVADTGTDASATISNDTTVITVPAVSQSSTSSEAAAELDDSTDFASLSAAVDSQADPEVVDDNLSCMATMIYFEAKGEPLAGQLAVAQVVLNRTRSGRFPKSICAVVTQPGQFSFVRGGQLPSINRTNPQYRRALAVARVAMEKLWEGDARDALFFHAAHVAPSRRMTRVAAIGHHVFYR